MNKQHVIFEMETSDPDDFLTLVWLADHPTLDLVAVAVTPGSADQCQLVRWALNHCGKPNLPIGSLRGEAWWKTAHGQKPRVSTYHYKVYGEEIRDYAYDAVEPGGDLIARQLRTFPDATVLVGSAPKNLHSAICRFDAPHVRRWIQQGGFAGDNLVAPEHRLAKFDGKLTCPSFNPGGAPKETIWLLSSNNLERRLFVSKNVCHGVRWTPDMQVALHNKLLAGWNKRTEYERRHDLPAPPPPADWKSGLRTGLRLMLQGLAHYQRKGAPWKMDSERAGQGKAMHDLVAAAAILDENVCTFKEVEVYRERGEWGAREKSGTNTWISVAFNKDRFVDVLAR